jgi:hypothetical protein
MRQRYFTVFRYLHEAENCVFHQLLAYPIWYYLLCSCIRDHSAACGVANSVGSGFVVEIRHVSVGKQKIASFFGTAKLSFKIFLVALLFWDA